MRTTIHRSRVVLAFATVAFGVLGPLALRAGAEGRPAQVVPTQVRLQPRTAAPGQLVATASFVVTDADGSAIVASGASDSGPLAPGQSIVFGVNAGASDRPDLCLAGIGGTNTLQQAAFFTWRIKVQAVSVTDDTATMQVEWMRSDQTAGGRQAGAGDTRTVTLREGEYHVLDFLSKRPGVASTCANLRVQIDTVVGKDRAIAGKRLGYDVWLVDQDAAGQETTRRLQSVAGQGETLPLHFFPFGFSPDGSVAADPWNADLTVAIDGWVKGRLSPDGAVQMVVYTSRAVKSGKVEGTTDWGEKRFATRPGEPVRIDIPQTGARLSSPVSGHKMSLTITVRAR